MAAKIIRHNLELVGVDRPNVGTLADSRPISVSVKPSSFEAGPARALAHDGGLVIAIQPESGFCNALSVEQRVLALAPPIELSLAAPLNMFWDRLRTLHAVHAYAHPDSVKLVVTENWDAVWLWRPIGEGGIMLLGSDLAEDLIRYRQGDPAMASALPSTPTWGFSFERPLHLFEKQLEGEAPNERHADWWMKAILECIRERIALPTRAILPSGAPGAVVITGDDDQAYLEKYAKQLKLLDGLPITYFLHPQTRHTPQTLKQMLGRPGIEVELHPDALDAPNEYGVRLGQQVRWFRKMTGRSPRIVRNHGFLNAGYWGHLPHWLEHGIVGSSNLPGFDGRILNGSLLPARMAYGNHLTEHWSILTAFGDGMIFAGGYSDQQAAERIMAVADGIRSSAIPGVIVLNLHPQNVTEAECMHHAAVEVIRSGFHAWNLGQCLTWFSERTCTPFPVTPDNRQQPGLSRLRSWLLRKFFGDTPQDSAPVSRP